MKRYLYTCILIFNVILFAQDAHQPIKITLIQQEVEKILNDHQDFVFFGSPVSTMNTDLPEIYRLVAKKDGAEDLAILCTLINQNYTTAPLKLVKNALEQAADLVEAHQDIFTPEQLARYAYNIQNYYEKLTHGLVTLTIEEEEESVTKSKSKTFCNLKVSRDLTVCGDVTIYGTLTMPAPNINNSLIIIGDPQQGCIIFKDANLVEKARICSSPIPGDKGVFVSVDMGVTQNLRVDTNGNTYIQPASALSGQFILGGPVTNSTNISLYDIGERNFFAANGPVNTGVTGADNIAIGTSANSSLTSANDTIALGTQVVANADSTIAIGSAINGFLAAQATEIGAIAIGSGINIPMALTENGPQASGLISLAVGAGAQATNLGSLAIGPLTLSQGKTSVAVGAVCQALADNSVSVGKANQISAGASQSVAVGANVNVSGMASSGIGSDMTVSGMNSFAAGANGTVSGDYAIGIGYNASVQGFQSIGIGTNASNESYASNSIAIGTDTTASGTTTIAIGYYAQTSSTDSIAIGTNANASNENAVALGANANASKAYSIILGDSSNPSVAVGIGTNTPAAPLHVSTPGGTGSAVTALFDLQSMGMTGDTPLQLSDLQSATGDTLVVNGSGKVFRMAPSSRRYKENIRAIAEKSTILYQIQPVIFDYNFNQEKNIPGFIAEEVYEAAPDLNMVIYDKQGRINSLNYQGFHALAISEIQKHQQQLDQQSSRITELLERIAQLQVRIEQLENH